MMAVFDPYHKWLGIPPEEQPPDHYRLLGLRRYESDADVIDAAADQRMSYVQRLATGDQLALSQTLLNELAAARVCLLTPALKKQYDRTLQDQLVEAPSPMRDVIARHAEVLGSDLEALPVLELNNVPSAPAPAFAKNRRLPVRRPPDPDTLFLRRLLIGAGGALLALIVVAVAAEFVIRLNTHDNQTANSQPAHSPLRPHGDSFGGAAVPHKELSPDVAGDRGSPVTNIQSAPQVERFEPGVEKSSLARQDAPTSTLEDATLRTATDSIDAPGPSPTESHAVEILRLPDQPVPISAVAFSYDGRKVAVAPYHGRGPILVNGKYEPGPFVPICVYDAATGVEICRATGHTANISSVAFSPDNRWLVSSGASEKTVRLWNAATGAEIRTFRGHTDWVTSAAFAPNGEYVVSTARHDTPIRIWNANTGDEVRRFPGHTDAVSQAVFSTDGNKILSASWDRTVRIWDLESKEIGRFSGHSERVWSVTVSPDARLAASADGDPDSGKGKDFAIRIWNIQTQQLTQTLPGHAHIPRSLCFVPQSPWFVSAGGNTAILWDLKEAKEIQRFSGSKVDVSPDGGRMLLASGRTATLWRLPEPLVSNRGTVPETPPVSRISEMENVASNAAPVVASPREAAAPDVATSKPSEQQTPPAEMGQAISSVRQPSDEDLPAQLKGDAVVPPPLPVAERAEPQFTVLWRRAPVAWEANLDLDAGGLALLIQRQRSAGYRPHSLSGYENADGQLRWAAVWVADPVPFLTFEMMNATERQQLYNNLPSGFRSQWVNFFRVGDTVRATEILVNNGNRNLWDMRSNLSAVDLQRWHQQNVAQGYRIEMVSGAPGWSEDLRYFARWTADNTPSSFSLDQTEEQVNEAFRRLRAGSVPTWLDTYEKDGQRRFSFVISQGLNNVAWKASLDLSRDDFLREQRMNGSRGYFPIVLAVLPPTAAVRPLEPAAADVAVAPNRGRINDDADNMERIYQAMKIANVRVLGGNFRPGDPVTITYQIVNTSRSALQIPLDRSYSSPFHLIGVRQHWIERQGEDSTIPANLARRGNRYAAGGSIIPTKATLAPGERLEFRQQRATNGYPAGKYTFFIEYQRLRDQVVLQTEEAQFELLGP